MRRIRKKSTFTAVAEVSDPACAARPAAFSLRASAVLAVELAWLPEQDVPADADSVEQSAVAPALADEYSPDDWLRAGYFPGDCFQDDYSA